MGVGTEEGRREGSKAVRAPAALRLGSQEEEAESGLRCGSVCT